MERARHKIEEVIKKQKRLLEQSQATTESRSAKDKSQYIFALGGVAAGLTIAVIVWLASSIVMTHHIDMSEADKAVAIHTGEIKQSIDNIAQLNERVESLTESVSTLEARLMQIMALTDSIGIVETKHAASSDKQIPEPADTNPTLEMNESDASRAVQSTTEAGKAFIPTHTVKARVNLRPSASLQTTPIAVLNVGTEIEYISKSGGWYYVNTQSHGKGWCSSDHLSILLPTQRKSSVK
ncbi:MAG: SH3 domain-containing protein [Gammaproteobacteria bacterium]